MKGMEEKRRAARFPGVLKGLCWGSCCPFPNNEAPVGIMVVIAIIVIIVITVKNNEPSTVSPEA